MLRREFLQGSAIVGASLVLPRILRASSGMWTEGGERKISKVLTARSTMVQNTPVIRSFAGNHTDLVSPWVMLDEFGPMRVEPGTLGMDIQAHPHAGVTPTTYLISGSGRHTDSLDNDIVYRKGEFMLFSSGRGAIHEEVSSDELRREGGTVHGFQIWLNTPAAEKFSDPNTVIHGTDETPVVAVDDATIKVMIGSLEGCASPVFTFSPAFYFHVELPAGGRLDLPVDPVHNAFVHMIEGQLEGQGRQLLQDEQLALYERGGDVMRFHALEDSEFLVLGGQPLNEPLVNYGPFVMNSQDQINACIRNYRAGLMGQL
jgi:redox-sensitive bicupin YhaK (pirin superfamily)